MNILLTGGAGYIGSHILFSLMNKSYKPIGLDNFSNSSIEVFNRIYRITGKFITYIEGDVNNIQLVTRVIKENSIDGVIHLAAHKAVVESVKYPIKCYKSNIQGL